MNTKAETQELAFKHIHLAYKIAWEYHGCGTEREELQAAALFGLVKAAAGFDRSRKVPFPAFASAVIRNTLRMEFRKAEKDRRCVSMEEAAAGSAEEGNIRTWADRIACRETGFDQAEEEDFLPSLLFESGIQTAVFINDLRRDMRNPKMISSCRISRRILALQKNI